LAAVEEQRIALVEVHAFDFAEEDGVIAGGVIGGYVAGEFGESAIEEWNATGGPFIGNAEASVFFGRLVAFGEMFGEGLLSCTKNSDAEASPRS